MVRSTNVFRRALVRRLAVVSAAVLAAACAQTGAPANPTQTASGPTPGQTAANASPAQTAGATDASFAGKTIRLVVGYDPGGSYDDAARSLQPYLEEVTGGTVVIENMPGAGNLIALNHVSQSTPDGTTIGTFNGPGNTVTVMTETAGEELQFELAELSYLVGLTSEPRLMEVAADGPFQTLEDVLASEEEVVIGVTGTSGAGYNDAVLFQEVFGDQVETNLVTGFESGAEAQLALIAGEVDVVFQLLGGELPAIEAGDIRGLVVLADERSDRLPDVPAIGEFDLTDEQRALLDVHTTISQLGIILIGPPGMDEATLSALQDLVFEAASDEALVAEQQERGIAWSPRDGETIRTAVLDALNAPDAYVQMMRDAVSQ